MPKDKVEEVKTYKINEVEIFSSGKWNDDEYSVKDLHDIVHSFNAIKTGFRPYLKLGHDNKQEIARSSGLPSVGWVDNLYVRGSKLLADLNYIPEKVFKLIKSRAYRKVSCEIYWNLKIEGNVYSRVLGGIAFLGAENPGVMNLDDILGNYSFKWGSTSQDIALLEKQDNFKTYSLNLGGKMSDDKSEKEIELEKELETVKKEFSKKEEDSKKAEEAIKKEMEDLKKFKLEAEEREAAALVLAEEAKRDQFVSELEGKKIVTPAMKPYVIALLVERKEYSINDKKLTKNELIEEMLKLATEASKVNFEENLHANFELKKDEDKEVQDKIEKYKKEHNCSDMQAYKAVMKETKKK